MSQADAGDDRDIEALAEQVAAELDTGTYGDKIVIPRRQALQVMAGSATLAGVLGFGTGSASAQSTGDESGGNVGLPSVTQDVWVDQLLDANDNEFLNVDPGEPINAQFGREWHFDSVSTPEINNRIYIRSEDDAQSIIEAGSSGDLFVLEPGATWDYVPPFEISAGITLDIEGPSSEYTPQADEMAVFQKAGNGRITVQNGVKIARGVGFDGRKSQGYTGDGLYIPGDAGKSRVSLNPTINGMEGDGIVAEALYDSHLHQTAITTCDGAGIRFSGAGTSHNSQISSDWLWINDNGQGIVYDDPEIMAVRLVGTIASNRGPAINIQTELDGGNSFAGSIAGNDGMALYHNAGNSSPFGFPVRTNNNGNNVSITGASTIGEIHCDSGIVEMVCLGGEFRSPGSDLTDVIVNAGSSNCLAITATKILGFGNGASNTGSGRLGINSLNNEFGSGNTSGCEGLQQNPLAESITKLSDGSTV